MLYLTVLLGLLALINPILATVPLIAYSYKLVPKVQTYVSHHNKFVFAEERVNEVIQNLVKPCTSNAYILVNQPGLTLDDLQLHEGFTYLRTYSFMSSTLAVMPRIEKPVDFDEIEKLIVRECDADIMRVDGLNEVETYIDVKTRLIIINLPELPLNKEERLKSLRLSDDAIRRTVRKLPSPAYSLIYTTLDKRLFDKYDEKRWQQLEIFHDIIKQDATRDYEYERNDRMQQFESEFPEKRTNLLNLDNLQFPEFFDKELILKNELLVIGVLFITFVLILLQILQFFLFILKKLFISKEDKEKKDK